MDDDGLREWEQRIPHFQFLIELFTEREGRYRWDPARISRFLRVQQLLLRNWENMKAQARQMANNAVFRQLWNALNAAKEMLKTIHSQIDVGTRHGNLFTKFQQAEPGKGQLLC